MVICVRQRNGCWICGDNGIQPGLQDVFIFIYIVSLLLHTKWFRRSLLIVVVKLAVVLHSFIFHGPRFGQYMDEP